MTDSGTFVAGTLTDLDLRRVVLGRDVPSHPAHLPGFCVMQAPGRGGTGLVAQQGARADGLVLAGLSAEEMARVGFYEGLQGNVAQRADIVAEGVEQNGLIFACQPRPELAPFDADVWRRVWGPTVLMTARDVMRVYGSVPDAALAARYDMMLVRGASRARAGRPDPATHRPVAPKGDVRIDARSTPYAAFFAVEEYDVAWRQFDGTFGDAARRAVFLSGDAVTVLPYDPVRDRVLLIEQFRVGPMARGDVQPWLLEAIAGRIDAGETPAEAARREAAEEAGLTLTELLPVAAYYSTPGANSEYLYSFVALCDLPDSVTGVFGLATEAEDIRSHLVPFEAFVDMMARGDVPNAPLILTGLWLQRERSRLRANPL